MNRGIVQSLVAALLVAAPLASRRLQHGRRQGQGSTGRRRRRRGGAGRRRRTADRPLHPRHRHADGRRTGRRRRRNRGPRRRGADRARHAGRAGRRARSASRRPKPTRSSRRPRPTRRRSRRGSASRPAPPSTSNAVPEVQNAKASFELAQSEFNRIKSLLDQRVVSQSEYDQRRTQMEAARQQYEAAKNGAAQQYQSLQAARARVTLARKALADTVVRAPFAGVVAERLVIGRRLRHQGHEGRRSSCASTRCACS